MPDTTPRRRSAPEAERATALMLAPALMLVLIALGSIAVDLTALHGAHRSLHRVVSAAADDAAGMLDTRLIQQSGELRIDPAAAFIVASAHVKSAHLPGDLVGPVRVQVSDDGATVDVRATVRVEHVMMGAVPGAGADELLTVSATSRLLQ